MSLQSMSSGVLFGVLSTGHTGFAIGHKTKELSPKNSILAGVREFLAGSVVELNSAGLKFRATRYGGCDAWW